jgi:hypothetical protein
MKNSVQIVLIAFILGMNLVAKAGFFPEINVLSNDLVKSDKAESDKKVVQFHLHPSIGLTFGDSNSSGKRITNLQWLATVNSDLSYLTPKFDLNSSLFMQYGQSKAQGQDPVKLQDAFILSVTPSIPIIKLPQLRLFLETTAETNLGKGTINDKPTQFFDPVFLYQTLFVGQKHYSLQKEDKTIWELTYGVGYAFQQTLNYKFKFENDLNGNKAGFESGFSGIIEFNINSKVSETINFVLNAKAVALSRENFFRNIDASRRSVLIRSGLFFKKVGIEYNYHQVHDPNLSPIALVDQSIMFTLSF